MRIGQAQRHRASMARLQQGVDDLLCAELSLYEVEQAPKEVRIRMKVQAAHLGYEGSDLALSCRVAS